MATEAAISSQAAAHAAEPASPPASERSARTVESSIVSDAAGPDARDASARAGAASAGGSEASPARRGRKGGRAEQEDMTWVATRPTTATARRITLGCHEQHRRRGGDAWLQARPMAGAGGLVGSADPRQTARRPARGQGVLPVPRHCAPTRPTSSAPCARGRPLEATSGRHGLVPHRAELDSPDALALASAAEGRGQGEHQGGGTCLARLPRVRGSGRAGDARARFHVGQCYESHGVRQPQPADAAKWYNQSADATTRPILPTRAASREAGRRGERGEAAYWRRKQGHTTRGPPSGKRDRAVHARAVPCTAGAWRRTSGWPASTTRAAEAGLADAVRDGLPRREGRGVRQTPSGRDAAADAAQGHGRPCAARQAAGQHLLSAGSARSCSARGTPVECIPPALHLARVLASAALPALPPCALRRVARGLRAVAARWRSRRRGRARLGTACATSGAAASLSATMHTSCARAADPHAAYLIPRAAMPALTSAGCGDCGRTATPYSSAMAPAARAADWPASPTTATGATGTSRPRAAESRHSVSSAARAGSAPLRATGDFMMTYSEGGVTCAPRPCGAESGGARIRRDDAPARARTLSRRSRASRRGSSRLEGRRRLARAGCSTPDHP